MKVIVCGDRRWTNKKAIRREMEKLPEDTVIIQGAARGADTIAKSIGKELGFRVMNFPADWQRYGRGAGPVRNGEMIDLEPELVLAFHKNLAKSKGTKSMVKISRDAGVEVRVFAE